MKNRDMFYQNVNQSYQTQPQFIPPSGYNINTQYQSYGPNMVPQTQMQANTIVEDEYENRISKLERQVKNLDTRLQKLENQNITNEDNFYMI